MNKEDIKLEFVKEEEKGIFTFRLRAGSDTRLEKVLSKFQMHVDTVNGALLAGLQREGLDGCIVSTETLAVIMRNDVREVIKLADIGKHDHLVEVIEALSVEQGD